MDTIWNWSSWRRTTQVWIRILGGVPHPLFPLPLSLWRTSSLWTRPRLSWSMNRVPKARHHCRTCLDFPFLSGFLDLITTNVLPLVPPSVHSFQVSRVVLMFSIPPNGTSPGRVGWYNERSTKLVSCIAEVLDQTSEVYPHVTSTKRIQGGPKVPCPSLTVPVTQRTTYFDRPLLLRK